MGRILNEFLNKKILKLKLKKLNISSQFLVSVSWVALLDNHKSFISRTDLKFLIHFTHRFHRVIWIWSTPFSFLTSNSPDSSCVGFLFSCYTCLTFLYQPLEATQEGFQLWTCEQLWCLPLLSNPTNQNQSLLNLTCTLCGASDTQNWCVIIHFPLWGYFWSLAFVKSQRIPIPGFAPPMATPAATEA